MLIMSKSEQEGSEQECQVAKVALRIPPFWKANVRLWLAQCDNAFKYSGIASDETKFSALIANIDAETLAHVSDIVLNPPDSDKYKKLSERLVSEFEDSEHQKIKKLLTELPLGDERPSHLLRKMRELSGNRLDEEFLGNLWLQRMPTHIQTVLSASSEKLDKLAVIADKVAEVVQPDAMGSAFGVSQDSAGVSTDMLARQIEELTRRVSELSRNEEKLTRQVSELSRMRPKADRFRSRSRSRPRKTSSGVVCFYHERFGDKARKCVPPCNYGKEKNALLPS